MAAVDDVLDDKDKERLERRVYLNLLYDFYSPLLTERQRNVYEMLYFSDLAPAEAARSLGISRQAVHILERRIMKRLEERIQKLEEENEALRREGR